MRTSVAVALLASACASTASAPAARSPASAPAPAPAASADGVGPDYEPVRFPLRGQIHGGFTPRVVLRDPGHAPFAPLRFAIKPGVHDLHVQVRQHLALDPIKDARGTILSDEDVTIDLSLEVEATPATATAPITVRGHIVAAKRVGERPTNRPIEAFAQLAGEGFEIYLTDRGQVLAIAESSLHNDGAIVGRLAGAVARALSAPLPVEPVGVGARWIVRDVQQLGGDMPLAAAEETTYRLEDRKDHALLIRASRFQVPLFDREPVPMNDEARAQAALTSIAHRSLDEIAHQTSTTARGSHDLMVGDDDSLIGLFQGSIAIDAESHLQRDNGEQLATRAHLSTAIEIGTPGAEAAVAAQK